MWIIFFKNGFDEKRNKLIKPLYVLFSLHLLVDEISFLWWTFEVGNSQNLKDRNLWIHRRVSPRSQKRYLVSWI